MPKVTVKPFNALSGVVEDLPTGNMSNALEAARLEELARQQRAIDLGFTQDAYHGTSVPEFTAFKRKQNDIGTHFGTTDQANDRIAYKASRNDVNEIEGDRIIPVKLKLNNPLRLNDLGHWGSENLAYELPNKGFSEEEINKALNSAGNESGKIVALRNLIQQKGYDGIVYKNTGEVGGSEKFRQDISEAKKEMDIVFGKGKNSFDQQEQLNPAYQKWRNLLNEYEKHREVNTQDSFIAFNSNQVRSKFAQFDPAKKDESGLLLGKATPTLTPVDYDPFDTSKSVDHLNTFKAEAPKSTIKLAGEALFKAAPAMFKPMVSSLSHLDSFIDSAKKSGAAGLESMATALENQYKPEGAVSSTDAGEWLDKEGKVLPSQYRPNVLPLTRKPDGGVELAMPAMLDVWNTLGGAGGKNVLGAGPSLRPALKYMDKIYKAKPGEQHLDALPENLRDTFQKQALSGEDITNFNFGFMNHKGQFLTREDALKYAIDNGILDPHDAKFGTLVTTMLNQSGGEGKLVSQSGNAIREHPLPKHLAKINDKIMDEILTKAWDDVDKGIKPSISKINPNNTIPTQDWLTWNNWGNMTNSESALTPLHIKPSVAKSIDGKYYTLDGHHRITNAIKNNLNEMDVHVIELDENQSKAFTQLYNQSGGEGKLASQAGNAVKDASKDRPTSFWRGINSNDARRIKTGNDAWDSHLFVSSNKDSASMYGKELTQYKALPDAKILYEGTKDFVNVAGKWRKNENMLDFAARASEAAKAAGFDAIHFKRQGDIGTAIFNPDKFKEIKLTPVEGNPFKDAATKARAIEQGYDTDNIFYHGSPTFKEQVGASFDLNHKPRTDTGYLGQGVYFTPQKWIAEVYAKPMKGSGSAGDVIEAIVKKGNYKDFVYDENYVKTLEDFARSLGVTDKFNTKDWSKNFSNALKKEGYDGARGMNTDGSIAEIAVFDPAHVRSTKAAFDPKNVGKSGILLSDTGTEGKIISQTGNFAKDKAPPFFSALENAVGGLNQAKASGEQWLGTLANQKGVKPDELEWTGLKEFLAGKKNVTKAEIQDYLKNNKVELGEVWKGTRETRLEQWKVIRPDGHVDSTWTSADGAAKQAEKIGGSVKEQHETKPMNNTKYEKWQLPGGSNYRELLLTLPEKKIDPVEFGKQWYDNWVKRGGDTDWEKLPQSERNKWIKAADEQANGMGKHPDNYLSSHWDEPNILAHIRMNDRTIDGKKSLHLEEIQSDFLQAHRAETDKIKQAINKDFDGIAAKMIEAGIIKKICD